MPWVCHAMDAGILSAVYVLGLIACLALGIARGPDVFEKYPAGEPETIDTRTLDITWAGQVDGMQRMHQVRD